MAIRSPGTDVNTTDTVKAISILETVYNVSLAYCSLLHIKPRSPIPVFL